MAWFFASGAVVVMILAVMLAEFFTLTQIRKKPLVTVALALAPGATFMFALLAAMTGAGWPVIALCLTVSLPLHLADMRHRRLL